MSNRYTPKLFLHVKTTKPSNFHHHTKTKSRHQTLRDDLTCCSHQSQIKQIEQQIQKINLSSVKIYPSIFTLKYHCKSYLFSLLKNFLQNAKTRKRLDKYFARYDSFNFWTNFLYNPLFNQINVNILFIIT